VRLLDRVFHERGFVLGVIAYIVAMGGVLASALLLLTE
jgi:hypothetical protein